MSSARYSRSLHLFSVFTGFCVLCLIGSGGLVTSHGVGMAVPDWPNTYGYNMFLFPVSQWVGGIFYEHTHRLVASFVGLLTTVLAIWLWTRETTGKVRWVGVIGFASAVVLLGVRHMPVYVVLATIAFVLMAAGLVQSARTGWSLRWLGVVAFTAVVLQGVLGGLRVVWAQDEFGIFHAALAQAFLVLLAVIVLMTSRSWVEQGGVAGDRSAALQATASSREAHPVSRLLLVTTSLVFLQLLIGATMRHQHAGLAIPDFPLAYGSVWPDQSPEAVARYNQQRIEVMAQNPITSAQIGLQMVHRIVAVGIVALVIWCGALVRNAFPGGHEMRRMAGFWIVLIGIQFGLGAWTIWSNKAADVASMHVICGALSLVTGGLMCVTSARLRRGVATDRLGEVSTVPSASLVQNQAGLAVK